MSAHGDVDLGHTLAGWSGTVVALIGTTGAGAAFCAGRWPGVWAGLAVVAAGAVLTWVLHLAGWGKPTGPRPHAERDWRVRDTGARGGHPDCLGCRLAGRGARRPAPAAAPVPVPPLASVALATRRPAAARADRP
ncbi:HGxxPAAW family protein [Streptomyces antimicrobicus]|uniref:Integral membrane protein n=1 Tax=Streptomyces antimicrobicus TaxID=2883108 RepID=A0ABS8BC55_9ACTN|nr:HGxxPAAW family protein [Streptomyces antimicrobicus]MCB5182218.1 hypothetical protein [Streptomyces antimicrobicus]